MTDPSRGPAAGNAPDTSYTPEVTPRVERLLIPWLHRTGAARVVRHLTRTRAVMGMYHGFTARDAHDGIANYEEKHLRQRAFRDQLLFLKAHYHVVGLDEVVKSCSTGSPLPDRAAVITIDDGYRSIYTVAYPVLQELQLPAAVFLATDFVDNRQFLWTDRVEYAVDHCTREAIDVEVGPARLTLPLGGRASRIAADRRLRSAMKALPQEARDRAVEALEAAAGCRLVEGAGATDLYEPLLWSEAATMAASGLVTIGSHTHTHVILSRCDPARAAEELRLSKSIIEDRLGQRCHLFCYPNGRRGDFNQTTKRLLQEHGFTGALTTVYGMNGRTADPFELKRYNFGKPLIAGELEVRLSGLMDLGSMLKQSLQPERGL